MDVVDRLHQRLQEAVAREGLGDGLTVRDLYQQLVPYRAVRGDLGLLELAQYEHALLRLLAGEGDHLHLEDERARSEISRELASPNPVLSIYRDYASLRVRIGESDALPEVTAFTFPLSVSPPAAYAPPPAPPPPPARRAGCRSCRAALPDDPDVRFCPACGADQTLAPCASCGTSLRREWNYCIRCGQPRADKHMFTGGGSGT